MALQRNAVRRRIHGVKGFIEGGNHSPITLVAEKKMRGGKTMAFYRIDSVPRAVPTEKSGSSYKALYAGMTSAEKQTRALLSGGFRLLGKLFPFSENPDRRNIVAKHIKRLKNNLYAGKLNQGNILLAIDEAGNVAGFASTFLASAEGSNLKIAGVGSWSGVEEKYRAQGIWRQLYELRAKSVERRADYFVIEANYYGPDVHTEHQELLKKRESKTITDGENERLNRLNEDLKRLIIYSRMGFRIPVRYFVADLRPNVNTRCCYVIKNLKERAHHTIDKGDLDSIAKTYIKHVYEGMGWNRIKRKNTPVPRNVEMVDFERQYGHFAKENGVIASRSGSN